MDQIQRIFSRNEQKYLLTKEQAGFLAQRLTGRIVPDMFPVSDIRNIYFDTPDNRLVRASLEKPVYKEKLRLRSYGVPKESDMVFAEIKKKFKGIVYKRRADLTRSQAEAFLYDDGPVPFESQILNEIDWLKKSVFPLVPAMFLSYHRKSYVLKNDSSVRLTFDSNIRCSTRCTTLDCPVEETTRLTEDIVMEIKTSGALPLWLTAILDELEIYPASFSKYAKAYAMLKHGGEQKEFIEQEKQYCA